MRHLLFIYCTILALAALVAGNPIWKVFCPQQPVFRGRADPIVEPGQLSQHSHKVWGASNFGIGDASVSHLDYFYHIRNSSCTTCSITIDLSNYWIPDLYYEWPNGSFSLVPTGGMTIYYLSRSGTAAAGQDKPDFQPFPAGLRMTSGSPTRRNFTGSVADQAIQYICLDYSNGNNYDQVNYFPTATQTCGDGLRAQMWFPMCWDGKNLDSPNHQSHMHFPLQAPDGGDCPSTHPVRLPGIFFEILFDVNPAIFPHGQGRQPFRWSCGDSTGYGLHGDFLNGWPEDIVYDALHHPDCDLSGPNGNNLAFGNNVKACPPLAPFVKDSQPSGACPLAQKFLSIEDLGVGHLMDHMPGCNPVTNGPLAAVACKDPPKPVTLAPGTQRVLLKSVLNGKFLSAWNSSLPLKANVTEDYLGYSEVFVIVDRGNDQQSILAEGTERYMSASNGGNSLVVADRGSPSGWELFQVKDLGNSTVAIVCLSNNKYLTVQADGTLKNNVATSTDPAQQWIVVNTNSVPTKNPPPQDLDSGDQNGDGGVKTSGFGKVEASFAVLIGATLLAL